MAAATTLQKSILSLARPGQPSLSAVEEQVNEDEDEEDAAAAAAAAAATAIVRRAYVCVSFCCRGCVFSFSLSLSLSRTTWATARRIPTKGAW